MMAPWQTLRLIGENTPGDAALYAFVRDLFWRRVAVMELVSGVHMKDLPEGYRQTAGNDTS